MQGQNINYQQQNPQYQQPYQGGKNLPPIQGYNQNPNEMYQNQYNQQNYQNNSQNYQYQYQNQYNNQSYNQQEYNPKPNYQIQEQNLYQNNEDYQQPEKKKKKDKKGIIQKDVEIDVQAMYIGGSGSSIFSDQVIRKAFVRKVLSIIGCQFLVTTLLVIIALASEEYREFTVENSWLLVICCIVNIGILIALYCFRNNCREVPRNYILLAIYTVSESYIISCICGTVSPGVVLLATLITAAIVFSLTLYALKTKNDITQKITFFIYAPFAIIALIIVGAIFQSYILDTIISLVIIAFFCAYLVFDIQRLTNPSKKNKFTYEVDDYIIAALDIYIDIIMIFQELLFLLSR